MEEREGLSSGVKAETSGSCHFALERAENPNPGNGGGVPTTTAASPFTAVMLGPATAMMMMMPERKKRGRPRKYGPDGSMSLTLSPIPISASAPPAVAGPATQGAPAIPAEFLSAAKRGRGRPVGSVNKPKPLLDFDLPGELAGYTVGANFTPHIITVPSGEDVTARIISFSQQGPGAICILSANGAISNVTLRQPDSSGGTLTYEGRFEILSLSGSFMPGENGVTKSRTGGMSVALSSPDGRVVGGGVAGLLVAASPVQVVVGSFMPVSLLDQKIKKPKISLTTTISPSPAIPVSGADAEAYNEQGQRSSAIPKPSFLGSSFQRDSWASVHSAPDSTTKTGIDISLPGG